MAARTARLLIAILAAVAGIPATAAPYLPESDAQILERLPLSSDGTTTELANLRRQWRAEPDNLEPAIRFAQRSIETGRKLADPRYYGYAEAVLTPWWQREEPPAQVLILRATLKQNRHDFTGALEDLAQALRRQPRSAQAWLTRAVIHQVRAEHEQARASCMPLLRLGESFLGAICVSSVNGLNGQARAAYALLQSALAQSADADPKDRLWALTALAECAVRLGEIPAAETHFREALALSPGDVYALGAYADLLLDQVRPAEVIDLVRNYVRIDGMLLRLALAEQQLGSPDLSPHVDDLRARFAAGRLRGETLHQGDEARYTLHLLKQPEAALKLAQANWAVQKEPRDARILLETAVAANDRGAAQPVLAMLRETKLEDPRLARLAAQLDQSISQSGTQ